MKNILLIATGGTIAAKHTANGLAPQITSEEIIRYIPKIGEFCQVKTVQVCSIDSTNMNPDIWKLIVETIEECYQDFDGFVISHGTDTLAYTAAAISYMVQYSSKPIVLTGAQKSIDVENTDGKQNLYDAFLYASKKYSQGVCIVFNGKVIAGTRGKKVYSKSFNAFDSIDYPFIAQIQGNQVIRYIPMQPYQESVRFYKNMDSKVFLLKLIPGMRTYGLAEIFDYYDAIVVESYGVGGIPESIESTFYDLHERHPETLVVLATQVAHEGSDMTVYEVGQKIKQDCHFLESYDMTFESVIAKTMWLLGNIKDYSEIENRFYEPINFDLVFGKNRQVN